MTTAEDVARWMADRVNEFYLPREATALEIREVFGEQFVVQSGAETWVIAAPVMKAFDKLTKATVVWVRGGQYWRSREAGDPPHAREVDW
jgi:hypothetical protein